MKKVNIVKSNIDFNDIMKKGKVYKNKYYAIYIKERKDNNFRFGIAVSKIINKAVNRNKVKRQIKNIVDKANIKYNSLDYIIVARSEIVNIDYVTREKFLVDLLISIIKERENEK